MHRRRPISRSVQTLVALAVTLLAGGASTAAVAGSAPAGPLAPGELQTARALARLDADEALALCADPAAAAVIGVSRAECLATAQQVQYQALTGARQPYPNDAALAVPQIGPSARPGRCGLGTGTCPRVLAALARFDAACARAIAYERAVLLSSSRWYGAQAAHNAYGMALQRVGIVVDLAQEASALADAHAASVALSGAIGAGGRPLAVSGSLAAGFLTSARTIGGPFAAAAPSAIQLGFSRTQLAGAVQSALAGIPTGAGQRANLISEPLPPLAPFTEAYPRLRATDVLAVLTALARGPLPNGAARTIAGQFIAAENAASVAAGRAEIHTMVVTARHTPGPAAAFFALVAQPLTASFQPLGPPAAHIASPAGGGIYALGQSVATAFDCTGTAVRCVDSSGAAHGTGTLPTAAAGQFTYTVTATNAQGRSAQTSISYFVNKGPTAIAVVPYRQTPNGLVAAILTDRGNGVPLPGETVQFTQGRTPLCTATTNLKGVAACGYPNTETIQIAALGFTASFVGDANHLPSSASGGAAVTAPTPPVP